MAGHARPCVLRYTHIELYTGDTGKLWRERGTQKKPHSHIYTVLEAMWWYKELRKPGFWSWLCPDWMVVTNCSCLSVYGSVQGWSWSFRRAALHWNVLGCLSVQSPDVNVPVKVVILPPPPPWRYQGYTGVPGSCSCTGLLSFSAQRLQRPLHHSSTIKCEWGPDFLYFWVFC